MLLLLRQSEAFIKITPHKINLTPTLEKKDNELRLEYIACCGMFRLQL